MVFLFHGSARTMGQKGYQVRKHKQPTWYFSFMSRREELDQEDVEYVNTSRLLDISCLCACAGEETTRISSTQTQATQLVVPVHEPTRRSGTVSTRRSPNSRISHGKVHPHAWQAQSGWTTKPSNSTKIDPSESNWYSLGSFRQSYPATFQWRLDQDTAASP